MRFSQTSFHFPQEFGSVLFLFFFPVGLVLLLWRFIHFCVFRDLVMSPLDVAEMFGFSLLLIYFFFPVAFCS